MNKNHFGGTKTLCITVAFSLLMNPHSLFAQGTVFTYQGRLNTNATPVTGTYDLRFSAFDAPASGSLIGGPVTNSAIAISNGLFNVNVDFGPGVFSGASRWLEIAVRTNGSGSFSTFGARQAILPAPYSMFAGTASNVVSGSVVKSINNLRDNVSLSAGANVTITPSGNTLTVSSTGPGGAVWSLSGTNTYYNTGNVGVGTSTPQGLLDVNSTGSDKNALFVASDPGVYNRGGIIHHQFSTYAWQECAQVTSSSTDGYLSFNYVNRSAPGTRVTPNVLTLRGNGNVGIGTTTPGALLDISSAGGDIFHLTGFGPFLTFYDSNHGFAKAAIQSVNGGLNFLSHNYLTGPAPFGFMVMDNSGNVGIGSATPAAKLDIASTGGDMVHLIGYEPYLSLYDSNHGYSRGAIQSVGGSLNFFTDSYLAGIAPLNCMMLHNNGNVGIGTLNPQAKLEVIGVTRTCVLTITGGCDVAEPFDMDSEDIPKGSVVVIDDERPGRLRLSRMAYDTRVAGIVSGANGINAGISLQQAGTLDSGQNVALSGRVYVQADAAFGAIKPGDLLTTSDTAGHAMKASDHVKAQGAIIGKAMSPLAEGKGLVLVLVTLQ